ncbi:hypothetical protein M3611_20950 [Priestia megaterium]|uniref:hypothetical protein n=1 Tax=Priestia megaterium TaxID=1404 RepID=UPI002042344F|nr:hypothetical protein [Priestia megaterium]MCM3154481.1 hypothetical protein [Priestia megaterium]
MRHLITEVYSTETNTRFVQGLSSKEENNYIWELEFDSHFNIIENNYIDNRELLEEISDFVLESRLICITKEIKEIKASNANKYIRLLIPEELKVLEESMHPEEIIIHIYSEESSPDRLDLIRDIPGTNFQARFDQPHTTKGQKHVHILRKGQELYSINMDGTAHHKINRLKEVQKDVANYLREEKGYKINANNILNMMNIDNNKSYRCETLRFVQATRESYKYKNN